MTLPMRNARGWWISAERGEGEKPTYRVWMEKEGIPVYEAFAGVEDLTELPRQPWARLGGKGTFIELEGTIQARELCWVAEIPVGGALEPERHLYDEMLYILRGRGLTEVWQVGQHRVSFEWGEGSLFSIPMNAFHRLVNGGREPALVFAVNSAPLTMNSLNNTEFIFNCDYNFFDRYRGEGDYFLAKEKEADKPGQIGAWRTNFVPDLRLAYIGEPGTGMGELGGRTTDLRGRGVAPRWFQMADGWSDLHIAWSHPGVYWGCHYHGPGAILLVVRSKGYVLMWDKKYGIHPYQDGYGDKVVRMDWKPNSIYSPPSEWFHMHFNTDPEPARHLAIKGAGLGFDLPSLRGVDYLASVRQEGGTRIEPEDEDPEIRRIFKQELQKKGVEFRMKEVVYRTGPLPYRI